MTEQELLDRDAQRDAPVRDPEAAQRALVRVQHVLEKQRRVEALVHREQPAVKQAIADRDELTLVLEAAKEAARIRLRPILMTSFAFIFGVLPLEIFRANGDTNRLAFGLVRADRQWENPLTNGLTRETRWWVDDGWMVGSLQIQAFRATGDAKYADRAAAQLAAGAF